MPQTHTTNNFNFYVKTKYKVMRDKALTIEGADIIKTKRQEQGSNQNWTIKADPDGTNNITITLNPTTNCSVNSAICSYGENPKMLSNTITRIISYVAGELRS